LSFWCRSGLVDIGFYSIENFRSKLKMADNLVHAKFGDKSVFDDWPELHARMENAAAGRNTLAHHWVLIFPDDKPGRRYGLQPFLGPDIKKPPKIFQKRPGGTLCIKDISLLQSRFSLLSIALHNYAAVLHGLPAQLPKSSEQEARPMMLSALRHQIHALCGRPPRSSRA
jgi:hypothetical protein